MKSTGITRKVDDLGRVVLPIELRRSLNIAERDSLEIFVDGNCIVMKKYELSCVFCGNPETLATYREKHICPDCLSHIKSI